MSEEIEELTCGLIMPISPIDGCSADHWVEVKSILSDAVSSIQKYNFKVSMVSDADEIGVIQKRIVHNIYASNIVICDVSGRNPNVMFELGMRLAFDKPAIIVKDNITNYSFDTSIIEHLEYPRDLRFHKIVDFKNKLASKVVATYEEAINNPDHSTFLKNFGQFYVANLKETEVTADKMIFEMLSEIQTEVIDLKQKINRPLTRNRYLPPSTQFVKYLAEYKTHNNITEVSTLLNDEKFYKYMEKKIDARMYFNSYSEFTDYLENLLRGICDISA